MLLHMLQDSPGKRVKEVLMDDFSRVTSHVADQICKLAKVSPQARASAVVGDDIERLHKALGAVKLMAPPASSIVPIGEVLLIEGLKRKFKDAYYVSATRPPSVYRGNPFVVEVGLAYGGNLPLDEPAEIMRFANRVPLQYQPKACAISEAIYDTNWKAYELQQPKGSLPIGPLAVVVHLASVWVPFTSEAKEAVAHYDELLREMKLAVQECGRRLGAHLRARDRDASEHKRLGLFHRYIPEVSAAIGEILDTPTDKVIKAFIEALPNFVKIDGGGEEPPPAAHNDTGPVGGAAGKEGSTGDAKLLKSKGTKVGGTAKKATAEAPSLNVLPQRSSKKRGEQLNLL
jgi:DNA topoisomerase-6 subunit B